MARARLAVAGLLAGAAIAFAGAPAAAAEAWTIESFKSDITINADSSLTIREDIQVDFGSLHKHGIFRTIPVRYRYDTGHNRLYRISVDSVTDGNRDRTHKDSIDSGNEVLQIGDADRTVSGRQRYVIGYTVRGAM